MKSNGGGHHQSELDVIAYAIVDRPHLPVLWLDTFAIAKLAGAMNGRGQDREANVRRYHRLLELVRADKLICVETDQLVELRDMPSRTGESVRILVVLCSRYNAARAGIEEVQERVAMRAHLAGLAAASLAWGDAIPEVVDGKEALNVRVTVRDDDAIATRRSSKETVKAQWSDIQNDVSSSRSELLGFQLQLAHEQFGMQQAFDHRLTLVGTAEDVEDEALLNAAYALRARRLRWQSCGGEDDIIAVREFYGSPHYLGLPYVRLGTELRALLMARPDRLKASDNMDVFNLAAVLPYADVMVIDRAMIAAVTKRKLTQRFGCRAIRLDQLDEFLDSVENGSWSRIEPSQK